MSAASDTIAAISTPIGFGGIGIVRLSGEISASIAQKVFRRRAPNAKDQKRIVSWTAKEIIPRRLHHGYIVDPDNQTIFNEVLMAYMPSPNACREDVIEIQAHGGTAALQSILELVIKNGARMAGPGEFTQRAYLNGRIDLSQAEAIIDLIHSKTEASLRIANRNLEGVVGDSVREIRKGLFEIKMTLESRIDFPEDIEEKLDEKEILRKSCLEILKKINSALESYRHGRLFREGARLVILGRPNVGKSCLLNCFLQRERAIVTSYPGTTRDSIEEGISLFGIPAVVIDTAGWRETSDPVERIGIERTRELSKNADFVLFMVDAGTGVVPEDNEIYLQIQDQKKMLIINKADLLNNENRVEIPAHWHFSESLYASAKFGHGLKAIKECIYKVLMGAGGTSENEVVPNLRQKNLFLRAKRAIEQVLKGFFDQIHPELLTIDIQEAMEALDEITGDTVKKDVLDEIFSRFCIGK